MTSIGRLNQNIKTLSNEIESLGSSMSKRELHQLPSSLRAKLKTIHNTRNIDEKDVIKAKKRSLELKSVKIELEELKGAPPKKKESLHLRGMRSIKNKFFGRVGSEELYKLYRSSSRHVQPTMQNRPTAHRQDYVQPTVQKRSIDQTQDLDKRFEEIKNPEKRLAILAEDYYKQGDRDKALKTIKEIYRDTETKEAFIKKMALAYYAEGNLDAALKTIKEIYRDTEGKESLIVKIANAHYNSGDRNKALKAIKEIHRDTETKEAFLIQLAQSYFSDKNEKKVLEALAPIVFRSIFYAAFANNTELFKVRGGQGLLDIIDRQTKICYERTKQHFSSNNPQMLLQEIKREAVDPSVVQAISNLYKR